jgi:hypothetical protein
MVGEVFLCINQIIRNVKEIATTVDNGIGINIEVVMLIAK